MKKIVLSCLSLVIFLGVLGFRADDRYFEMARNLDIFASLYKEINTLYVEDLNPNRLIRKGIEAMLAELDPYTNFYPEDDIEEVRTMATGKYNGIGASVFDYEKKYYISQIFEGSPADLAGLKVGDEVLAIGPVSLLNRTELEVNRLVRGQTGTSVKLSIQRYGQSKPMVIDVVRGVVKTPNVPHFGMVTSDVGYIQLTDFSATAAREIQDAYEQLTAQGMKKVILDLRGNPGGLLNMAIDICNFFLPKGQVIVETKGRLDEWNKVYKSMNDPLNVDIPVAVLINGRSASASEIVSGTLQDYDRAVVIGQQSFGKGLVQTTRDLSFNTKLKVTTAKYYTPSGRCIQAINYGQRSENGEVNKVPDSLRVAFKTQKGRTVYDGGGVTPDVLTPAPIQPLVLQELLRQKKIFDYATHYYYRHTQDIPDNRFVAPYEDFVQWLVMQSFSYQSPAEKHLVKFTDLSKKEGLSGLDEVKELERKFAQAKKNDLLQYKNVIQAELTREILGRYHYQKAAKFLAFEKDPEVMEAVRIFSDVSLYRKILP